MSHPRFDIEKLDDNRFCWALFAANGAQLAISSTTYTRRRDAERARDAAYLAIFYAGESSGREAA
jgi:uncharacterized protein YegP (UPF0339 family)